MSKKRAPSSQRSISRARATHRPQPAAAPAPRPSIISPGLTHWLRTSWIPIAILVVVLVAIVIAMYFRLTEATPAAAPYPASFHSPVSELQPFGAPLPLGHGVPAL